MKVASAALLLLLTGCVSDLGPSNWSCSGLPEFSEKSLVYQGRLPGIEPGMTREQVRLRFQEIVRGPGDTALMRYARNLVLGRQGPGAVLFLGQDLPGLPLPVQE